MFYKFIIFLVRLYYAIFFRLDVKGLENIPEGAAILCANHISNFDPLSIAVPIKRLPSFLAKKELFKISVFGKLFSALDVIPVDREKPDMKSFRTTIDRLKTGHLVVIFAMGTRTKEDMAASKAGVALFATKSGAPVIPTAIITDYKIFRKVRIVFGEPMYFTVPKGEKVDAVRLGEITASVTENIKRLMLDE